VSKIINSESTVLMKHTENTLESDLLWVSNNFGYIHKDMAKQFFFDHFDEIIGMQIETKILKDAIAAKGGNEHAPTQFAYDKVCEIAKIEKAKVKILQMFLEEITSLNGKYPELNGTQIVADANHLLTEVVNG